MKDKDFRELADREFAQLEWTDRQRMDTLRQMNKEEKPVMKRKLIVVIVTVTLLLTGTVAVAAGVNSFDLQYFFDHWLDTGKIEREYPAPTIGQSAVVNPVSQRHTSTLVDAQIEQIYLSPKALYFTNRYTPKAADTLLFSAGVTSTVIDGVELDYWDMWDYREYELLEPYSVSISHPDDSHKACQLITGDRVRDPETGAITEMHMIRDSKFLSNLNIADGGTLTLNYRVMDLRNHDMEHNVLYVDFPRIETVEKDPLDFTDLY